MVSHKEYCKRYKSRYKDYKFRIKWDSSQPYDPECETVDVRLNIKKGEYSADFVTRKYLDYIFEKNKRTGESASGTYFAMPGMIIVDRLDEPTIKTTIDNLIENLEVELFFKKIKIED